MLEEDKTGDGDYGDADELENRSHNLANEITGRDPDDDTNEEITYTYDNVGNMRTEVDGTSGTVTTTYTHDGWNRLVKVEVDSGGGATTRLENSYNGLNWRVSKRSDTDLDGSLDEQRVMYYNASWQLVEEEIYEGWTSGSPGVVDEQRAYIWGNRYIDDAVAMFVDTDVDDSYEDSPGSERYFYLTDAQFSVVAVMDDAANLQEKIQYDAYGQAIHHDWRDTDGDGDYDSTDRSAIGSANGSSIGGVNYSADYDVDRDGDVDLSDVSIAGTTYPTALSRGELSYASVGNVIGYDGYLFNTVTELYTVRNRTYDTVLGRWLERDPGGLIQGLNLFRYVLGAPITAVDPLGLFGTFGPGQDVYDVHVLVAGEDAITGLLDGAEAALQSVLRQYAKANFLAAWNYASFLEFFLGKDGVKALRSEIQHAETKVQETIATQTNLFFTGIQTALKQALPTWQGSVRIPYHPDRGSPSHSIGVQGFTLLGLRMQFGIGVNVGASLVLEGGISVDFPVDVSTTIGVTSEKCTWVEYEVPCSKDASQCRRGYMLQCSMRPEVKHRGVVEYTFAGDALDQDIPPGGSVWCSRDLYPCKGDAHRLKSSSCVPLP